MNTHSDAGCMYAIILLAIAVGIAFIARECDSGEGAQMGCQF